VRCLIIKLGALGDVLRTTSILPGLHERYPDLEVTWVTAPGAVDLVRHHRLVADVHAVASGDEAGIDQLAARLGTGWDRVLSFDDEPGPCRLASRCSQGLEGVLSGAYADGGRIRYTPDTAPWFDMGLLSRFGKEEADRLKKLNRESHAAIYARMLGLEPAEPELPLSEELVRRAEGFLRDRGLAEGVPIVGLNTGAGGRWESKKLPVDRVLEVVSRVHAALDGRVAFLVLGGPDEAERNGTIVRGAASLAGAPVTVDAGTDHPLLEFAAIVDRLDLLLTSDSLALHVGVARRVPIVAFFAPTSAPEIELFGRGEKVESTAPDACAYRPDADTSTLTPERIASAVLRVLSNRAR